MTLQKGLGYHRLSPQEQQAYTIILNAFSATATIFDSSHINSKVDIMKVLQVALNDNPSVIYFDKTKIHTLQSFFGKQIELSGVPPKSQIKKMAAALDAKANSIVATIQKSGGDAYTQILRVYEYLQEHTKYDQKELSIISKGRTGRPTAHNAYGALIEDLAVCSGFSGAFALLIQKLGFESMTVTGRSTHRSVGFAEHAWNIIKVNNRCYHMDLTWDTNQYAELGMHSYDYFALDDEEIANDHDWDINTTPACSYNDLSYYLKSGLYANTKDRLDDILENCSKNRDKPIRVKLSLNIMLPQDAGEYIAQLLFTKTEKAGGSVSLNYWWNEHNRCFTAKFIP